MNNERKEKRRFFSFFDAAALIATACSSRTRNSLPRIYKMEMRIFSDTCYSLDDEIQRQEIAAGPEVGFGIVHSLLTAA
jgi:hypothetical protein